MGNYIKREKTDYFYFESDMKGKIGLGRILRKSGIVKHKILVKSALKKN
jgi:hypothetical protein